MTMHRLALSALALCGVARWADGKTVPATNVTTATRACQPPYASFPFCNTALSLDERINDLIGRLQPSDIAPLLTARHGGGGSPGPNDNITRLGVPEYDWGVNCIHGVQTSCIQTADGVTRCPVSFPNPVNYGATWNRSLAYDLGATIATELRALWLAGATEESPWSGLPHAGLDCWSPTININRDPRWGRNQEAPSEEPLINGLFGTLYTQGLQQGEDPRYTKVVVTLKHWDAYSLEDSDGFTRYNFNAVVSRFALGDTFFPAFKMAVTQGQAKGVMCSYNAVNGVPTCASSFLTTALRGAWNFTGYITSDSGALEDIYQQHKYVATEAEAACVALVNGTTDVCSGAVYHDSLLDGVSQGLCTMADVNTSLYRTFKLRFELGLFDPIDDQPYWQVPPTVLNATQSQDNNLLVAQSSMVLLQNNGSILPLPKGKSIAVIGPHATAQAALLGSYLGQICPDDSNDCVVTPFQAIAGSNVGGNTQTSPGCAITDNSTSGFAAAVALAQASDYVVLMLGIDETVEGESHDRTSIDLPYIQHQLAAAIVAVRKPTVPVLLNGGMVDITAEKGSIGGIISAGYPGFQGSYAIAQTLFGDNQHLGGKLPYTIYPANYVNQIAMSNMEMDVGPGRSYRYYNGSVVFPFGWGLAYTSFAFAAATLNVKGQPTSSLIWPAGSGSANTAVVSITVANTGAATGDEVVQLYIVPQTMPAQPGSRLQRQLIDFGRVNVAPGASATVNFTITTDSFVVTDKAGGSGDRVSTPGTFTLLATNGVALTASWPVMIIGEQVVVDPFPAHD